MPAACLRRPYTGTMVRAARQDSAKFAGCFLRILLSIEGSFKTCRMVRIRTGQTASPGGSWLREAQTDEGQNAPNICIVVSIVPTVPHPALRATFPQGKALGVRISIKFRGKDPRKPKRFSWALQGGRATCPYPLCPFGTFPLDRGDRPPCEGSRWY